MSERRKRARGRAAIRLGIQTAAGLAAALVATPAAHAGMAEADRWVRLPETIYTTVGSARDQDHDGLKDDLEARLADIWRPFFIFDEAENNGANTSQLSLQSWEPRVLFRVHPGAAQPYAPSVLRINWGFLFRMDGGFRASWICDNHHSGDTQLAEYELISKDGGVNWRIDRVDLRKNGSPWTWTNASALQISAPIANIAGAGYERPLPIIFMSAGKHHQYYTGSQCENAGGSCDEDCAGGASRVAHLMPWGYWTNVGEPNAHPTSAPNDHGVSTINRPFINYLGHIGYPNEEVWWANWQVEGCGAIFTGGMNPGPNNTGAYETGGGDTCTTPVVNLFQ